MEDSDCLSDAPSDAHLPIQTFPGQVQQGSDDMLEARQCNSDFDGERSDDALSGLRSQQPSQRQDEGSLSPFATPPQLSQASTHLDWPSQFGWDEGAMSGDGQALAGLTAVDAAAPAASRAALPKQLGHVRHGPYPSPGQLLQPSASPIPARPQPPTVYATCCVTYGAATAVLQTSTRGYPTPTQLWGRLGLPGTLWRCWDANGQPVPLGLPYHGDGLYMQPLPSRSRNS